jgi:hypothetical protein
MANESELDIFVKILLDKAAEGDTETGLKVLMGTLENFENKIKTLKASAREMRGIARDIGQISREAFAIGTVITGGIFAAAAKYVKDAKVATEITEKWKAAQDSLAKSGTRVGAVMAEAALPLLEKAAQLAVKAADFIEKNPEIVRAALNTGLVLAGLGAVGMAVSKGIKLYADVMYLAAVAEEALGYKQFDAAVNKFIAGVAEMQGIEIAGNGTNAVKGAGVVGTLGTVALYASSVVIGAELGNVLGNAIAKLIDPNSKNMTLKETAFSGGVRAEEAVMQKFIEIERSVSKFLSITEKGDKLVDSIFNKEQGLLQKQDQFFQKLFFGTSNNATTPAAASTPTGVAASPKFDQALKAYEDYKNDDLKLVQDHYKERQKIVDSSLKAENDSNARYASRVTQIDTQRSSSLAQAAQQFAQAQTQADQQYQDQRAQTIRDGNIAIQDIEKKHQLDLQKMAQEHADRIDGFARARDALGLVKEQRDYKQRVAESNSGTREEIAQRRRDIALRLSDLQKSYEEERAQRAAEYAARVQEINVNANQQLAELRTEHNAEIQEIRNARIRKIKELDAQFLDERKRRTQQFIATLRDLDASLLGEKKLREQYQTQMTKDLDAWLADYRKKLGTLGGSLSSTTTGTAGARAGGGYATYGTYLLGDAPGGGRGRPEYVMGGDSTQAMQRALGGNITEDKIIQLAALMGGGRGNQITYQDSRRIDSRVSAADRNRMADDTLESLREVVKNAIPR